MENYLLSSPTQLSQPYDYDENFDFLQNLYQPIDPLAQLQQLQSQQQHTQQQFQQLYQHHQQQFYQDQHQQLQQLQVPQQFHFPTQHFEQPQQQPQPPHQQQVPHLILSQPLQQLPEDSDQLQDPYLENEEWTFPKSRSLNFDSINKSLLATPSTFVHKSSNSVTSITYEPPSSFNSPITPSRNRSLSYTRVSKTPKTPTPRISRSISKISLDQFIQSHSSGNTTSPKIDLLSPSNYINTAATPLIKPRKPVMTQNSIPAAVHQPMEDLRVAPPPLSLVIPTPSTDELSDTLLTDKKSSNKKSPSHSPLHSEAAPVLATSTVPTTTFATTTSTSASTSVTGSPPEPTTIPIPSNMVITKNRVRNNRSMQSREDKNKKYSCPICDGRFMRPEHVKRHLRSHTLEKPFECEQCQKTFNRKDNLKAHMKKIHKVV
ncbi:Cell wall integrity transcriptional regulator CAS5 [Candida viswanathii]|uniref:Cell wall integrity transcriptional regulator CAS5 n=1 Tax=Candida viswanathii TaxID=5486 RepID=A0A367Y0L7_9ASCO|nr:Cell wall integrity transcriptional regulator CAS5 [Candida viswanathii]